jgi:hypothetical protein
MRLENLGDEIEYRMVWEEEKGIQFLSNSSPRSLRGTDSELHRLWDQGKEHGFRNLPAITERELKALASERVNSERSRHSEVDEEKALLEDLYHKGKIFGGLVKKHGSEEAALQWKMEQAEERMAWEEREEIWRPSDPPLQSVRGTDPELHQVWNHGQANGSKIGPSKSSPYFEEMALRRVGSGAARHNTADEEKDFLHALYIKGKTFGRLVNKHGSEEAALKVRVNLFKAVETPDQATSSLRARAAGRGSSSLSLFESGPTPPLPPAAPTTQGRGPAR